MHPIDVNSSNAYDSRPPSQPPPPAGYTLLPAPGETEELVLVKRKRGRPKKIELAPPPSITQSDYNQLLLDARDKFIDSDSLVQAGRRGADAHEILSLVGQGLAEEIASLAHCERDLARRGRDVGLVSSRRSDALRKLATVQEALMVQHDHAVDIQCETVQRALAFWVGTVMGLLGDVLLGHELDLVINRLQTEMGDFEARVAEVLR